MKDVEWKSLAALVLEGLVFARENPGAVSQILVSEVLVLVGLTYEVVEEHPYVFAVHAFEVFVLEVLAFEDGVY